MSIDEETRLRIGLPASPASNHPDASAHDASLLDIDAKYGDVVSVDEAIAVLRGA